MKKKLEARLAKLRSRYDEVTQNLIAEADAEARAALGETLAALKSDIDEVEDLLEEINEPAPAPEPAGEGERGLNVLSTVEMRGAEKKADKNVEVRSTMEYREAFMRFVKTGEKSAVLETRNDDQTTVGDLGVLIPQTVVQEIIKGTEKVHGQLYSKVKKTNIKGGVKYPIGSFSATFNRIVEEGNGSAPSERQAGGSVTGYVEFGYKIGEIRLAQTLLMSVMGVEVFEQELAKVIVDAYVEAMDKEIINGDPDDNEMVGILDNSASGIQRITALSGHVIEISPNDMKDWKTWQKKFFAKIPLSMRAARPEFVLTAGTFESNLETLEDSNGQPVARNIYNPMTGDEEAKFKGRTVTFVEEDIFPNFEDASNNAYFGMYWVAEKAYAINSNLEFAVNRYWDNEKNQWVQKGIVINDGKILDPKYIFLLKKVANS